MKRILLAVFLLFVVLGFSQEDKRVSGYEAISELENVNAFPNPLKDKTTIFFNTNSNEEVTVIVQNLLGKVVFLKKIGAQIGRNSVVFYRNRLSKGVYIYTVAIKDKKTSKRLVIK